MLILIKIGGSLITKKNSSKPTLNRKNLYRISEELRAIKKLNKRFIIVHGAGSFGHPLAKKYKIDKGLNRDKKRLDIFCKLQVIQNKLNMIFCEELLKRGIRAFPFQPSTVSIMEKGELKKVLLDNIKNLLNIGIIPVLNGVPAYDKKQGIAILSGDDIMMYLAKELRASLMLFATDVDGVFSSDPKINKGAKLIERYTKKTRAELSGSLSDDVSKGMFGKVNKILKSGVKTLIFNGNIERNIRKAILGEKIKGTIIN